MTRFFLTCLLLTSPLFLGCGGGASGEPKDRPKRTPVSGVVTLAGTPLEGATVTFHSSQGGSAATGRSDSQGKFVLGTFSTDDGAVPGSYLISVIKMENTADLSKPPEYGSAYNPKAKAAKSKSLVPEKYSKFGSSGLKADVGETPIVDYPVKLD